MTRTFGYYSFRDTSVTERRNEKKANKTHFRSAMTRVNKATIHYNARDPVYDDFNDYDVSTHYHRIGEHSPVRTITKQNFDDLGMNKKKVPRNKIMNVRDDKTLVQQLKRKFYHNTRDGKIVLPVPELDDNFITVIKNGSSGWIEDPFLSEPSEPNIITCIDCIAELEDMGDWMAKYQYEQKYGKILVDSPCKSHLYFHENISCDTNSDIDENLYGFNGYYDDDKGFVLSYCRIDEFIQELND